MLLFILFNILIALTFISAIAFLSAATIKLCDKWAGSCDEDVQKWTKRIIIASIISPILMITLCITGIKETNTQGTAFGTVLDAYTSYGKIHIVKFKTSENDCYHAYMDEEIFKSIKVGGNYTVEYNTWLVSPYFHPSNRITKIVLENTK